MTSYFEHPWGAGPSGTSGTGLATTAKIAEDVRKRVFVIMAFAQRET
jgi:hypothetical protein